MGFLNGLLKAFGARQVYRFGRSRGARFGRARRGGFGFPAQRRAARGRYGSSSLLRNVLLSGAAMYAGRRLLNLRRPA